MTALILTRENSHQLKHALRRAFCQVRSSHLSEALAAALGFRTHAAFLTHLHNCNEDDPEFILLNWEAFWSRLSRLSAGAKRKVRQNILSYLGLREDGSMLVKTTPPSSFKIKYRSQHQVAWRNLMVSAVNAGLEQRLFSLKPGDNRWPCAQAGDRRGYVYRFEFGSGIPAIGYVGDAGWDELSVHATLWPTKDGEQWVRAWNAGSLAGEAFATGWIERREGAWLQCNADMFVCRRARLKSVAQTTATPRGYGDRGKVIL